MEKLTKKSQLALKEVNSDVFTFLFTSNAVDRDNERVDLNSFKFSNFLKNPVVLYMHDYRLPIGKVINIYRQGDAIYGDIKLSEVDTDAGFSMGKMVKELIIDGVLNAVSIGFSIEKYQFNETDKVYELFGGDLLEVSVVSLPANQEAVRQRALDLNYDEKYISKLFTKAGAELNRANKEKISNAVDSLNEVVSSLGSMIKTNDTDKPEDEEDMKSYETLANQINELTNSINKLSEKHNEIQEFIKGLQETKEKTETEIETNEIKEITLDEYFNQKG